MNLARRIWRCFSGCLARADHENNNTPPCLCDSHGNDNNQKLIIIMKLSELNGTLVTVSGQLTKISNQIAARGTTDPELPADAAASLAEVQSKVSALETQTANPS